jgi:hypothetical protein
MNDDCLAWLVGCQLKSFIAREYDWVLTFDGEKRLVIECMWRVLDVGRIRLTSQDDGQRFGLSSPINAANEADRLIAGASIEKVILHDGTLDLDLSFSNGRAIQVIPTSSGYEAWNASDGQRQFIAGGGGDLTIFG